MGYNTKGEVVKTDHNNNAYDKSQAFDGIGNRTTATDAAGVTNYTSNNLNQYSAVGTVTRTHDDDGNALGGVKTANNKQLDVLKWNGNNRLTKVTTADGKLVFVEYDHMGRRFRKSVVDATSAKRIAWIYVGYNAIAKYEAVSNANLTLAKTYYWGIDLGGGEGTGGMLSEVTHGNGFTTAQYTSLFTQMDGNGNVTEYLKSDGTVAAHFEYDSFGQTLGSEGASKDVVDYGFSSRAVDRDLGMSYYNYRYYNTVDGRWINRDPVAESGGINVYGFVGNSSINYADILGLALYAFDGTNNDRRSNWNMKKPLEEQSPTNVAILASIYNQTPKDKVYYMHGVGTRDGAANIFGLAGGLYGKRRIRQMIKNYKKAVKSGDCTVNIIGFSRGAAMARDFANELVKIDAKVKINWIGLYDTVPSFGVGGNAIDVGYNFVIPKNVGRAYQIVAAQRKKNMKNGERRFFFPVFGIGEVTDHGYQVANRHHEVFAVGAHSDIGGGYNLAGGRKNISNITLKWMRDDGVGHGVPFGAIPAQFSDTRQNGVNVNSSNWTNDKLQEYLTKKTRVRTAYDSKGRKLEDEWSTVSW